MNKLRSRLRQLEEAVQNTCKDMDEKEARMKKEHKMLQDVSLLIVAVALVLDHLSFNVTPYIYATYIF